MLETELKRIITKDVYEKIHAAFSWDSEYEQVNYYYSDKNGLLRKNHITVRVRTKDGMAKLQIKNHKNSDSALQICEETERDIQGIPEIIDAKTAYEATGLDCGELFLMGSAATLRSSLMWDGNTEICLDRTRYFGITDYEIEVEYTYKVNPKLIKQLSELGVEFNEKTKGKFSRFLKEYKKIKMNEEKNNGL